MKYNPEIHHRRSIRLKEYDYSQPGTYFITLCTHNKEFYFKQYPQLKQILIKQWQKISDRYNNIELDEFTTMPNHLHGIITLAVAQNKRAGTRPAPTIGGVIGSFKSLCVYDWLNYIKENRFNVVGKFWQRNYYEHIIRNENELNKIREYIQNNPLKWHLDRENPERIAIDVLENEIFKYK